MKNQKEINVFFVKVIDDIDLILKNDYYNNKSNLEEIKSIIKSWYESYKKNNSLKEIDYKRIEFMQDEIYDFFDNYFANESIKENYSERLLYDFGHIVQFWKDEMLGEKNV